MDDMIVIGRRLMHTEGLLNLLDALRPDMPIDDLHVLALQTLIDTGEYMAGALWICHDSAYYCVAWQGMNRERTTCLKNARIEMPAFQSFLDQFVCNSGMYWRSLPLPSSIPTPLQSHFTAGHSLLAPLSAIGQVGFALLETTADRPQDDMLALLNRFTDKIAIALETSRLFQEHLHTIDELQRLTEEQRRLQEMVLELSAPLLPLLPGVLVLPLIGVIDAARAERILEAELDAIIKQQAAVVLVDITGVTIVDTAVAMQIVRSADAARLLGCRTLLVGVRPEIAQTLVGLGADLRGITTRATLAEGLREALRLVHRRLVTFED